MFLLEIECALRSSIHTATGVAPFFALFGYNMFTSATDYKLTIMLKSLEDHEIRNLNHHDKLELWREKKTICISRMKRA